MPRNVEISHAKQSATSSIKKDELSTLGKTNQYLKRWGTNSEMPVGSQDPRLQDHLPRGELHQSSIGPMEENEFSSIKRKKFSVENEKAPVLPAEVNKEEIDRVKVRIDDYLNQIDLEKKSLSTNVDMIFRVFMLLNSYGSHMDRKFVLDTIERMNLMAEEICKKQKGKEWIGHAISGALQIVGGALGCSAGIAVPAMHSAANASEIVNHLQPFSTISQGVSSTGGGTNTVTEIFSKRTQANVEHNKHYLSITQTKSEDRRSGHREEREKTEAARRALEQMLNALHESSIRLLSQ